MDINALIQTLQSAPSTNSRIVLYCEWSTYESYRSAEHGLR